MILYAYHWKLGPYESQGSGPDVLPWIAVVIFLAYFIFIFVVWWSDR